VKLGIRARLFLTSLVLISLSVAAADGYLIRALDDDLTTRTRDELLVRAQLIERDVSALDAPLDERVAWDVLADELGQRGPGRITLIRKDGWVLGDSGLDAAELARVENHASRPEVQAALAHGRGFGMRFSTTVRRRLLYVAVPFVHDGQTAGVVRLATPLVEVDEAISKLRRLVLLATVVALIVALLMSTLAAHFMSRTVRDLTSAAQRMAAGDLAVRTRLGGSDELAELGHALDRLAGNLANALSELRGERDLLSRVLQGMREGVLLLDREGQVALANAALREMLLLGPEVVGKSPLEVIRNAELKHMLDEAAEGDETVTGEIELGDLKPRRLLVHVAALPGEAGGLLAVFVDVTDLRRLETIRRDFVANVSHELRTPVAAVRSAAETLRKAIDSDPAAALDFIDIIERQAQRLQRLVEDLLDLARIESRQLRLSVEPVMLGTAVGHTLSLFREGALAKGMRLSAEIADDLPPARADRRALEQVLSNLIDNAVKYGSEGASITVRATAQDGMLRVSVSDTGPGIEAKHLPRLFERFYRVDAGRSRELGGTGLGLSIVKHMVESMGGRVSVETAPGTGTTFAFTLPSMAQGRADVARL
jgi:two-component system phosphate regulon sensor histidine kinase PhoR